jgi:drug/metabolite transporter (DMT)-like permease
VLIGLGAALVAMVLNSIGALLQADGALRATRTRPVAVQPRYLAGLGTDGLAWLCSAFALRYLPVFAVQAVLGGAIALTALAGTRMFGTVLRRVDRWAVGACLAGLVLVAASAGATRPPTRSPVVDVVLLVSVLLLGVAVLVLRRGRPGWPLAVAAGLGFGGSALAVRAAHVQGGLDPSTLLAQPATYLVLGFWAVGLIGYSAALSRGHVASMTALLTVTEVLVPGLAGIALLGDPVRPGWPPALGVGLAVAVVGVVVLARSPGERPRRDRRRQ